MLANYKKFPQFWFGSLDSSNRRQSAIFIRMHVSCSNSLLAVASATFGHLFIKTARVPQLFFHFVYLVFAVARRCKATTEDDYATYDLALQIRSHLCTLFNGRCPAVVLNNLVRAKFDANRDKAEATFGVTEVEGAFEKYQEYIENAKANIVRRHGVGLFIDVHGQSHRFV